MVVAKAVSLTGLAELVFSATKLYGHMNVCRLIQEEKQTTELRAEELESRAVIGGAALEQVHTRWRCDQSYERSSPPMSGRSTPSPRPSLQSRGYVQKYHTLNSSVRIMVWT